MFAHNVFFSIIKQVPYAIHIPIERPIPIKIIVPHPYPVEKRVSSFSVDTVDSIVVHNMCKER